MVKSRGTPTFFCNVLALLFGIYAKITSIKYNMQTNSKFRFAIDILHEV